MTNTSAFRLIAVARNGERAAIHHAAALLCTHLSAAAGHPHAIEPAFRDDPAALADCGPGVVVVSLASELDRTASKDARSRWEPLLRGLVARDAGPVFLCTVFRLVHDDADPTVTIERIRRINLLAAELSQATGVFVVDLDRALAHVGGRTVGADYRLASVTAQAAAGHVIAATLLSAGLDPFVPIDLVDHAKASLGVWQLDITATRAAAIADAARDFAARRDGQRVQVFHSIGTETAVKSNVDDLLAALRARRMGLGEAAVVVARGLRRMGPRRAAALAWREASRRLSPRAPR
jgi:hypothetical protein